MKEAFKAKNRAHGAERLERLKRVVLDPELNPHSRFDFNNVLDGDKEALRRLRAGERHCGTVGCMMGCVPAAFPEHWRFSDKYPDAVPVKDRSEQRPFYWQDFFALNAKEFEAAFYPNRQYLVHRTKTDADPNPVNLQTLTADATAEQACANLDIIISRMNGES